MSQVSYREEHIKSLDWKEHIRLRPGMYIGKLGDGSAQDDGIYVLIKEIIDNSIDEYVMGYGKELIIEVKDGIVKIRDYGRGIPLGKVIDCVSKINTGESMIQKAFKKSVGLNGVGTKAVNALSDSFTVQAVREGKTKIANFQRGVLADQSKIIKSKEANGTIITFVPDASIFKKYKFRSEYIENQLWNYAYLNAGLRIRFNGKSIYSKDGLLDLLKNKTTPESLRYPIIHLIGDDIEMALTHGNQYGEEYYSFVNGQYTTQGGTHLGAFREAIVKTIREHFGKNYDARDIQSAIIGAISVRVEEPVFESQTKTKLGSQNIAPEGVTIRSFVLDFVKKELDNFLHRNTESAKALQKRVQQSERERKEIAGVKKLANERAKKANLHNKKLRDCRIHYNDKKKKDRVNDTTIFITEGDSASGSITKARDVQTQAVFFTSREASELLQYDKKIVYQNEEFNLLQHALNIEDGIDGLRYNKVVIATDADVDGMHIRLLLLTFFLQFFPDLVKQGHLYILETPLFRVRDKSSTYYCYSEAEKAEAIEKLRGKPEITRFKGLGEISPTEFEDFIGSDMRLEPVYLSGSTDIHDILSYYMGKNTPQRQKFIIDNLKVELLDVEGEDAERDDEEQFSPKEAMLA